MADFIVISCVVLAIVIALMLIKQLLSYVTKQRLENSRLESRIQSQKRQLILLFEALDGVNWKNSSGWCGSEPLANWKGIYVDTKGRVNRIILQSNQLRGTSYISVLPNYLRVNMSMKYPGCLPKDFFRYFPTLVELDLRDNHVTGVSSELVI